MKIWPHENKHVHGTCTERPTCTTITTVINLALCAAVTEAVCGFVCSTHTCNSKSTIHYWKTAVSPIAVCNIGPPTLCMAIIHNCKGPPRGMAEGTTPSSSIFSAYNYIVLFPDFSLGWLSTFEVPLILCDVSCISAKKAVWYVD